jgi:hypothetical protein
MTKRNYDLPDRIIKAITDNAKKRQLTDDELIELAVKRELKLK